MAWSLEPQVVLLVGLIAALVIAAVSDAIGFVIPNSVVLAVVGLFLASAALSANEVAWISHLVAAGAVLAAGFLLFHYGLMGGGDVKLWAACALWAGTDLLAIHLVYVTLIGVAIAVALIVIRATLARAVLLMPRGTGVGLPRLLRRGEPVPYGIAIAAGSILLACQIALRQA